MCLFALFPRRPANTQRTSPDLDFRERDVSRCRQHLGVLGRGLYDVVQPLLEDKQLGRLCQGARVGKLLGGISRVQGDLTCKNKYTKESGNPLRAILSVLGSNLPIRRGGAWGTESVFQGKKRQITQRRREEKQTQTSDRPVDLNRRGVHENE